MVRERGSQDQTIFSMYFLRLGWGKYSYSDEDRKIYRFLLTHCFFILEFILFRCGGRNTNSATALLSLAVASEPGSLLFSLVHLFRLNSSSRYIRMTMQLLTFHIYFFIQNQFLFFFLSHIAQLLCTPSSIYTCMHVRIYKKEKGKGKEVRLGENKAKSFSIYYSGGVWERAVEWKFPALSPSFLTCRWFMIKWV